MPNQIPDSPSPLILVVDDDIFMRGMLQNLLESQHYRVVEAADGAAAIQAFSTYQPDLVLLDAAMPIMDGFIACTELRKLRTAEELPIIMITALDDENSVDRAFAAGAVEYITKPIHWAVLRHRVQVIFRARQAQIAIRESENRFRGIFECAAMGIALVDLAGHLLHCNLALQRMLGHSEHELRGKLFNKLFYPYETTIEKEFHQQLLNDHRSDYQMEKYFFRPNSPMLWGRLTTSLVRDANQRPQYLIQMVEDITERKRSQAKQRLATKVFETTTDGIMITNAEGNIVDVNQAFLMMTGYNYEEILDHNPRFLKSNHHDKTFYDQMWASTRETGRWNGQIWNRHKQGEIFSMWVSLNAVRGEHNEVTHYLAVYSDLSRLKDDDQRMRLLTHYDSLTELPNRLLFNEYLTRACRQGERLALLYLDLDDFKNINEKFGYDLGDEFLKILAKRLKQCVHEGDTVSRLEGDEFGIILSTIHQDYDARLMAEKIFDTLTAPVSLGGQSLQIDCNLGICFYPEESISDSNRNWVEILVQHADMAMYLAKEMGKNTYYVYTADFAELQI